MHTSKVQLATRCLQSEPRHHIQPQGSGGIWTEIRALEIAGKGLTAQKPRTVFVMPSGMTIFSPKTPAPDKKRFFHP